MLWAHQGPQSTLVSTVGVWHLTLCRASFWTMQTASKELYLQEKQSVCLNCAAKDPLTTRQMLNWLTLGENIMLDVPQLVTQHFFDINNNRLIITSRQGQMLSTDKNRLTSTGIMTQSQDTVIAMMELCSPWGMFQNHSDACQWSLLLPWNICKRGTIEQKKTV